MKNKMLTEILEEQSLLRLGKNSGWPKLGLGLAIGAVLLYRKPLAVGLLRTGLAAGDRIQEVTSTLREEWEDIVAEAHFNHLRDSIDKDIASDAKGGIKDE